MRNITFQFEETLIQAARTRAQREGTSVNALFRLWLADYAGERRLVPAEVPAQQADDAATDATN